MTRFSTDIDSRLDALAAEARDRLASIPGQPTAAEIIAEVYRGMVRAFGPGYHPDTDPADYTSFPEGYDHDLVCAVRELAHGDYDLDTYDLALEAVR